jgi:hypothetical protein
MSGIEILNVNTLINGKWVKSDEFSAKISDIINSFDELHFIRPNDKIQICFVSNNHTYIIVYKENTEITRDKIINLQDVESARYR